MFPFPRRTDPDGWIFPAHGGHFIKVPMTLKSYALNGLIAAAYTPFNEDHSVNYDAIPAMVDFLHASGNTGIFVCGSTGEGASLTTDERRLVAEAYSTAAEGKLDMVVHVGHNSVYEAAGLAAHAASIGANAVAAICPTYFPLNDVNSLIESMKVIANGAPDIPFYYYHIPSLTGVSINIDQFLATADKVIPNLRGVKFTSPSINDFLAGQQINNGKYDMVFGVDEMMISGLLCGSKGFVGSTYNFMAPLYIQLMKRFEDGNLDGANELQRLAESVVRTIVNNSNGYHPAVKTIISRIGIAAGPCRAPLPEVPTSQADILWDKLMDLGVAPYLNTVPS